jgi:RNA polymerase sigma-70 factor, ECF subfamily
VSKPLQGLICENQGRAFRPSSRTVERTNQQAKYMEEKRSATGSELTELLQRLQDGDKEAMQTIIPMVYEELKKLASANLRRQTRSMPLETTALVHEAFLRLSRGRHPPYENRTHFYGIASRVMRQVLVDTARAMRAEKRGPGQEVALADLPDRAPRPNQSLLAVDDALQKLEKIDPLKARVIDLRYFGGMTAEESSLVLSIPVHTVRRELRLAQAWLRKEIAGQISEVATLAAEAPPESGV